jgi:hypothetical protein
MGHLTDIHKAKRRERVLGFGATTTWINESSHRFPFPKFPPDRVSFKKVVWSCPEDLPNKIRGLRTVRSGPKSSSVFACSPFLLPQILFTPDPKLNENRYASKNPHPTPTNILFHHPLNFHLLHNDSRGILPIPLIFIFYTTIPEAFLGGRLETLLSASGTTSKASLTRPQNMEIEPRPPSALNCSNFSPFQPYHTRNHIHRTRFSSARPVPSTFLFFNHVTSLPNNKSRPTCSPIPISSPFVLILFLSQNHRQTHASSNLLPCQTRPYSHRARFSPARPSLSPSPSPARPAPSQTTETARSAPPVSRTCPRPCP